MSRWISDIYIRARMKQNPLLQGNCEYELWKQFVDQLVDAMPSIEITRCRDCKWNSECRMLDDDNGYCSQADRKTENSSEKPNNSTISKMEQVDEDINVRSKSQIDDFFREPTAEERKAVAEYIESISIPTGVNVFDLMDEPKTETQTETQNSNLTFEKRTMRDCYNCKRYEAEGECIECHYEAKDEPQTELVRAKYHCINCAENGSYKCSKCDGEMYYKYDKDEPQTERSE